MTFRGRGLWTAAHSALARRAVLRARGVLAVCALLLGGTVYTFVENALHDRVATLRKDSLQQACRNAELIRNLARREMRIG